MFGVNFGTLCHIFTLSRSPYRESLLRGKKRKLSICDHRFKSSTQLQNRSFHVVKITRGSVKCPSTKNASERRVELLFFIMKYANL